MSDLYEFSAPLREAVQSARDAHGYTQDEVGESVGKTGKSISNIERGITSPEFQTIYKLFRLLEIDANTIFYPNRAADNNTLAQFNRLLAGCSEDELEMLLDVARDILAHTRKYDEIGTAAFV